VTYPTGGYQGDNLAGQGPPSAPNSAGPPGRAVDAARLWTGGAATALIAALIAVVGVLIASGLFDVSVLGPTGDGSWGEVSMLWLAVMAALAALLATGLLHLLLLSTPQPRRFFSWIVGLTTAAAALIPFLADAELAEQVASAAVATAIGGAIGSLLTGVASRATRVRG
jgi:Family of unknown function (DUF6069)